jgi:hypothetical protein
MSKMHSYDPFGYLKHKLWLKEGPGIKLPIWFPTTKSQESLQFPCMQVAYHILLEALDEGYNFALNLTSIGRLHTKLWASKVSGIPILGISRQNVIWVLALWPGTKYTIRGKVVASPKFGPWWVLWVRICPWLVRTPKVLKLHINQLVWIV